MSQDRTGGKEVLHDVAEIAAAGFGRIDVEGNHWHASSTCFGDNACESRWMKNIEPDAVNAIVDGRSNKADHLFNVKTRGTDQICVHIHSGSRVAHPMLDDAEQLLVA